MNTRALATATIAFTALAMNSTPAQADPSIPMQIIDASATQLCDAVNSNPTGDGALDALYGLDGRLDAMDVALVIITAVHHVCPQHEGLLMNALEPVAEEELCTEPW